MLMNSKLTKDNTEKSLRVCYDTHSHQKNTSFRRLSHVAISPPEITIVLLRANPLSAKRPLFPIPSLPLFQSRPLNKPLHGVFHQTRHEQEQSNNNLEPFSVLCPQTEIKHGGKEL